MRDLLERMQATIDRRGLLSRGQSVLVAVSGGADSMVLLHLLHELSWKNSWRLTVAHLNHRLRGRSSAADERLVVRTAGKLGLPVIVEQAEVRKLAREQKLSIEMAARQMRHDFLARTAERLKIRTVALAHHADDQLELFFLRLLRGSGSEGLAGMKWKNPSPVSARIHLIRPLLDATKAELLAVTQENRIPFREDASNASLDIQRNRIRHELLPLLRRDYQPAIDRTLLRTMEIVGAESEFTGQLAAEWLADQARHPVLSLCEKPLSTPSSSFSSSSSSSKSPEKSRTRTRTTTRTKCSDAFSTQAQLAAANKSTPRRARSDAPDQLSFDQLPVALQRRCIQLQLRGRKIAADFELVENLRTRPGHFIKVSPHLAVSLEVTGVLGWQESQPLAAPNSAVCQISLKGRSGRNVFSQVRLDWRVAPRKLRALPKPRAGVEHFDADKVGGQIVLRHWRAGDRFQPSGMKSPVKLQDLFVNAKIPRGDRSALVVATMADGEIFWVERLRMAERFKWTDATNRGLQWHWKRL